MRTSLRRALICIVLWASQYATAGADLKPFTSESIKDITAARDGRPFVVAFWSLSCTYCREDLEVLAAASRLHPKLDIVLVATDAPEEAESIAASLAPYRFAQAESWVFADAFAERLRFAVDRNWHGELPRTYLYDARHRVTSVSGSLQSKALEDWIKRNR